MTHDSRYAAFDEMFAVMHYDKEEPEVITETRELANEYLAGQWSDEYLSVHPVKVIRYLPPTQTLYEFRGRVPYGSQAEPAPEVFDYKEFPGLGNGTIVPLGQVRSEVSDNAPYNWSVNAWGWDRAQTMAAFEEKMVEARSLREARREAFSPFPLGCVVRTSQGDTLIRTTTPNGVLYWNSASGVVIHDAKVDPASLTLVAAPPGAEERNG